MNDITLNNMYIAGQMDESKSDFLLSLANSTGMTVVEMVTNRVNKYTDFGDGMNDEKAVY